MITIIKGKNHATNIHSSIHTFSFTLTFHCWLHGQQLHLMSVTCIIL